MGEMGIATRRSKATEGEEEQECLQLRLLREDKVWRLFVAGRGSVGHVPLLAKRAFACDSMWTFTFKGEVQGEGEVKKPVK